MGVLGIKYVEGVFIAATAKITTWFNYLSLFSLTFYHVLLSWRNCVRWLSIYAISVHQPTMNSFIFAIYTRVVDFFKCIGAPIRLVLFRKLHKSSDGWTAKILIVGNSCESTSCFNKLTLFTCIYLGSFNFYNITLSENNRCFNMTYYKHFILL